MHSTVAWSRGSLTGMGRFLAGESERERRMTWEQLDRRNGFKARVKDHFWDFADATLATMAAEFFDTAPPKFVVSTTLESAEWGNATVLGADWAERLREIKAGDGPDLGMSGSITLIRSLIAEGLLDELHLLVHPVVVGKGQRLFPEGVEIPRLERVESTAFGNGVTLQRYRPADRD